MGIASGVVARTKYPSAYERPLRARSGRSRKVQEVVLKWALLASDRGVGDTDDDVV